MSKLTLTQMRYFEEVCRSGSFVNAARQLHVSQAAVSVSIKNAEIEIGFKLFERDKNSLHITQAGEIIRDEIGAILRYCDHLDETIDDLARGTQRLRIGLSPLGGTSVFPLIYNEFKKCYPEVIISNYEDAKNDVDKLETDQLDALILVRRDWESSDPEYLKTHVVRNISQDRPVYCISSRNKLAENDSIDWEEIAQKPLILSHGAGIINMVREAFEEKGLKPRLLQTSQQIHIAVRFAETDVAGTFLPISIVKGNDKIKYFVLDELRPTMNCAVWKKENNGRDVIRKLDNVIRILRSSKDMLHIY